MRNFITIFLILFTFVVNAQKYKEHKVKSGETIESIAKQYLVTPFDIYALNPDAKTTLAPNTVLIIPNSRVKNQPIEEDSRELIGYKKHKVKRKETLYGLSKKYGVSEEEIKKANRFLYSENLQKGQKIKIPQYKTFISRQTLKNTLKKYTVQAKEGKWRVAYKFGIKVADLEALNPSMNEVLQPGDVLNVPNIEDEEEKPVETNYDYYEVLPKEGFYRLKIKTGLTQEELEVLNPELKETGLVAGMVLKLPVGAETSSINVNTETTRLISSLNNFETKKLALMLPYQLHKIDTDSVDVTKSEIRNNKLLSLVLDFHVGVTMALDSAKKLGISTELKVLDTKYSTAATGDLLRTHDFSGYDAVIGPINETSFDRVASELKSDRIPVVAALKKPKELYSNVFQTIPEDELLRKAIIDFVKKDTLKARVMIFADAASKSNVDKLVAEFPRATVKYARKSKKTGLPFFYPTDLTDMIPEGKTYVFLEAKSNAFASSVISMLNGEVDDNTEIILTTLDKGKAFKGKDISNNNLSKLKFHYASVNKDFNETEQKGFVAAYKKQFGILPSKYVARGFDITLDLLLRLASNEDLYESSNDIIETEYVENKFRYNKSLFGGYKNEAVYIVKYHDLRIVKVN
ncbi:MAG: LysM peptidoglycan-binding domain-containing protein [Winogradskyella sp.]|uniref:LysM peptidoglycan-binding domain-containing protein n=1 Tax=Winogradskyella sp. TaxID=1883156 RepID=UPI0025FE0A1B|nr:LysM peptidoglycan-binding domain-containing protein [Winogradskyella sp.]NRB58799.1 LysM peptidoglycan-binding domain-containing protein [Winogradskyella sp.]